MRSMLPRYPVSNVSAIAIRWILDTIPGSIALTGIKQPQQIKDNAQALGWRLANEDLAHLGGPAESASGDLSEHA